MSLRLSKQRRNRICSEAGERIAKRVVKQPVKRELAKELPSTDEILRLIEATPEFKTTVNRPPQMKMSQKLALKVSIFPDRSEITLPKKVPVIMRGEVVLNADFKLTTPSYWTNSYMALESIPGGKYHETIDRHYRHKIWQKESEVEQRIRDKISGYQTLRQLLEAYPQMRRYKCVQIMEIEAAEAATRRKENAKPRERITEIDRTCIAKARLLGAKL